MSINEHDDVELTSYTSESTAAAPRPPPPPSARP